MTKINQKLAPKTWITVDTVIFCIEGNDLKVLLIRRQAQPFINHWSLPGGFITETETSHEAAKRVLKQKAEFTDGYIEQLYTFDSTERDPRERIISVAYFALVPISHISKSKSNEVALFPVKKLPTLAFDHKSIIQYAIKRLRAKLEYTNAAYSLLPRYFTLAQFQKTYEIILDRKLDKRNFRKKFMLLGLIKSIGKTDTLTPHRPARLYQFISRRPSELKKFF